MLGKYKMKHRDPKLFYLSMEVMICKTVSKTIILEDDARPAKLSLCNPWGECRFTLQMRKGGLVRIYDSVLMSESQYKSLLISEETTVRDVVMILFHCYGLAAGSSSASSFNLYEHCRTQNYERKLNSEDRPLAVQDSWLDPDQFRLVLRRAPALKYNKVPDVNMNMMSTPVVSSSSIHGGYNLHSVSLSQSTMGEGFVSVPEYSGRRSLALARVLWQQVFILSQSTLGEGFGPKPVYSGNRSLPEPEYSGREIWT